MGYSEKNDFIGIARFQHGEMSKFVFQKLLKFSKLSEIKNMLELVDQESHDYFPKNLITIGHPLLVFGII